MWKSAAIAATFCKSWRCASGSEYVRAGMGILLLFWVVLGMGPEKTGRDPCTQDSLPFWAGTLNARISGLQRKARSGLGSHDCRGRRRRAGPALLTGAYPSTGMVDGKKELPLAVVVVAVIPVAGQRLRHRRPELRPRRCDRPRSTCRQPRGVYCSYCFRESR